jgi:predicted N-acetyltransferase YhbS
VIELRALRESDDRSQFRSGDPDLDRFFQRFAGQRYPLPVLRLARLAVDQSAQGQGLGAQLLRLVFQLALRMANDYGCVGVIVDAKPDAVDFYARYGFIPLGAVEGQSDARPQPTPMFLSIRALKDADETPC